MIRRLHANNFRSMLDFELEFGQLSLLLGGNGAGKSSVLELLDALARFATGDDRVGDIFPPSTLNDWERSTRPEQQFELDLELAGEAYRYRLEVAHDPARQAARMQRETLLCGERPLFDFRADAAGHGVARLYRDDFTPGPEYAFEPTRSGIGTLLERHDNNRLSAFKRRLDRVLVVRPAPQSMTAEGHCELRRPDVPLHDFASWLRFLMQEHQGQVFDLTATLREAMPGFDSFSMREAGATKVLYVGLRGGGGGTCYRRFDQLSDGERALIALHALQSCLSRGGFTIAVDEPENFLALPEIQPWLDRLNEVLEEQDESQAVLVSHHPRLINFLASDVGAWIDREGENGPSRARPIGDEVTQGTLSVATLVERGWIYDA